MVEPSLLSTTRAARLFSLTLTLAVGLCCLIRQAILSKPSAPISDRSEPVVVEKGHLLHPHHHPFDRLNTRVRAQAIALSLLSAII